MLYAKKGNKVNSISEQDADKYLANGFIILDESGKTIKAPVPTDLPTLQMYYKQSAEIIDKLKSEIKALTDENAKLKSDLESAKTSKSRKPKSDKVDDEASDMQ